jgi:hypothetical protein
MTTITFEQWRPRFEKSLVARTTAWNSLQTYVGFLKEHPLPRPPLETRTDVRTDALRSIYELTCPAPEQSNQKRIRDAHIRHNLRKLTTLAETLISDLQDARVEQRWIFVTNDNQDYMVDLAPLQAEFQDVVRSSRRVLSHLEWRGHLKRKSQDIGFHLALILERKCNLRQRDAFPLIRLALLAHGYPEDALEDLNLSKIRAGNFRRRKKAYLQRLASWYKVFFSTPDADK